MLDKGMVNLDPIRVLNETSYLTPFSLRHGHEQDSEFSGKCKDE